jgi:hypothetical protein
MRGNDLNLLAVGRQHESNLWQTNKLVKSFIICDELGDIMPVHHLPFCARIFLGSFHDIMTQYMYSTSFLNDRAREHVDIFEYAGNSDGV